MRIINALLGFGGHGPLNPSYVVIHETAGPGAPATNLVSWWKGGGGLPVHYVGDWTGDCYYCVPEDEICWQVGNGNLYVVGIELCHATNQRDFDAVWELGVEWAAWQLSKRGWGIDRLLSHYDCTIRWGGSDHTDPIGYFEEFGRSWEQFKNDVQERLDGDDVSASDVWGYKNERMADVDAYQQLNDIWKAVGGGVSRSTPNVASLIYKNKAINGNDDVYQILTDIRKDLRDVKKRIAKLEKM